MLYEVITKREQIRNQMDTLKDETKAELAKVLSEEQMADLVDALGGEMPEAE